MRKAIYAYWLLLCYAVSHTSCHSRIIPQQSAVNKEVTDSHGNPKLLGPCTKERLQEAPYDTWFVKNYQAYTVDSGTADQLKTALAGKQFRIFMGTWCGDSKREVPRIFKILDYCRIPANSVQLIMVDNADSTYKQSPGHEEKGLDIFRVPDLLVYDRGQERGRIVESPVQSLEKDLLTLATGQPYTPNYKGVDFLIHQFRTRQTGEIQKELPLLAAQIKPLLGYSSELNSYAHVMQVAGETEKAAITRQLNALIFQ
jgi:hypothetical protein